MTDYKKLVKALRICTGKDDSLSCIDCPYREHYPGSCRYEVSSDAADAIESLQKELDAANHQLKMYSMCPFDDEEEEE